MANTHIIILKLQEQTYADDSSIGCEASELDAAKRNAYPVVYPEPFATVGSGYGPLAQYVHKQCGDLASELNLDLEVCHQVEYMATLYAGSTKEYARYQQLLGERLELVRPWITNAPALWPNQEK